MTERAIDPSLKCFYYGEYFFFYVGPSVPEVVETF